MNQIMSDGRKKEARHIKKKYYDYEEWQRCSNKLFRAASRLGSVIISIRHKMTQNFKVVQRKISSGDQYLKKKK